MKGVKEKERRKGEKGKEGRGRREGEGGKGKEGRERTEGKGGKGNKVGMGLSFFFPQLLYFLCIIPF